MFGFVRLLHTLCNLATPDGVRWYCDEQDRMISFFVFFINKKLRISSYPDSVTVDK